MHSTAGPRITISSFPYHLLTSRLGMFLKELAERRCQLASMLIIVPFMGNANIIKNHVSNFYRAVFVMQQVIRKGRRSNFRDVLMLCNRKNLGLANSTKCQTVLQRYH